MKQHVSKERAESRVTAKFRKLWVPLVELLDALQALEAPGSVVTDVTVARKAEGGISVAYKAAPARISIVSEGKRYTLMIEEAET
jgi:hypothetical protein